MENLYHINRTTLSKKFSDATGIYIKNYLIKLRIRVAALMLKDTLLPITEIAYRVGFNDSTYFTRMFKKYLGCLPGTYRNRENIEKQSMKLSLNKMIFLCKLYLKENYEI